MLLCSSVYMRMQCCSSVYMRMQYCSSVYVRMQCHAMAIDWVLLASFPGPPTSKTGAWYYVVTCASAINFIP